MTAPPCPSTEKLEKDAHLCALCGHWCGRQCEREFTWNVRFLAYCTLEHDDAEPEAVLAADRVRHVGGRMTPFIIWCRRIIGEWQDAQYKATRRLYSEPLDHKAFDEWLRERVLRWRIDRDARRRGEQVEATP